jgi:hypothetical protein
VRELFSYPFSPLPFALCPTSARSLIPVANQEEIIVTLAQTPLYQLAVELKARLTSFGGWEMPVQFTGISREHEAGEKCSRNV